MKSEKDYLSEFELEWNSNGESGNESNEFELDEMETGSDENENEQEFEDDEFELDDEYSNNEEYDTAGENDREMNDEFELNEEFESNDEFEVSAESEVNPQFTTQLYDVLNGNHESEFEFEQRLNEVLTQVEREYFFGGLKRRFNKFKKSGLFSTLKKVANKTPLGGVVKQYTALARGDIKGMLKGLAGQALTTMVPGGTVAKQLLNLEVPFNQSNPRKNAQIINQVAKKSYTNLIRQITPINSTRQLSKIPFMGKSSYNNAWKQVNSNPGHVRRIFVKRGETLVIKFI